MGRPYDRCVHVSVCFRLPPPSACRACGLRAGSMAGEESRLVVAIRPRPLAPSDECDAGIRLDTDSVQLCGAGPGGSDSALLFDRVFTAAASNGDVYSGVALPVVRAALTGINGAVAAYGQTGSGKTRTMRGTAEDPGIVPRAVRSRQRRFALSLACELTCHWLPLPLWLTPPQARS